MLQSSKFEGRCIVYVAGFPEADGLVDVSRPTKLQVQQQTFESWGLGQTETSKVGLTVDVALLLLLLLLLLLFMQISFV